MALSYNSFFTKQKMSELINLVLRAGHSAFDVAVYTLLPIMVVMMILMRFLELYGVIDRIVALIGPFLKPFGLSGLSVVAMLQMSLVSFVAPLPTLKLMEDRGVSDRSLSAATAAMLAMAPANALFPIASFGASAGTGILLSVLGGLTAASCCYYIFGRRLSKMDISPTSTEKAVLTNPSFLKTIEISGTEAMGIVVRIIPMLMLSLLLVYGGEAAGLVAALTHELTPVFAKAGLSTEIILPTLTKYLAGSTALTALYQDMALHGGISPVLLKDGAIGFLLHPFDVAGIAILLSAGRRVAHGAVPAIISALTGIAARAVLGLFV